MQIARIHIIESPSPEDFLEDRREGSLLVAGLKLFNIAHSYNIAIDTTTFKKAIESIDPTTPILHISAHGSKAAFNYQIHHS